MEAASTGRSYPARRISRAFPPRYPFEAPRTPADILSEAHTIALVGASPKPHRPSHRVMRYLLEAGYRVVPVRPLAKEVLGIRCVPSLADVEEPIDLVDVFRRAAFCPQVAEEAATAGAKALWLQLGIVSPEARAVAERAGMDYVENECTAFVHRRLARSRI